MKKRLLNVLAVCALLFSAQPTHARFNNAVSEASAAKELPVPSALQRVTVFNQGAQIERRATFSLPAGKTTLQFVGLTPHVIANSIRVEGNGAFTINTVQFRMDYAAGHSLQKRNETVEALNKQLEEKRTERESVATWLAILSEQLDFLKQNKSMGNGSDRSATAFAEMARTYSKQVEELSLQQLDKRRKLNALDAAITELEQQVRAAGQSNIPYMGVIDVVVDVPKACANCSANLLYNTTRAHWTPQYDMRFTGTSAPLQIGYKAQVYQETGIDWSDVEIVLSSAATHVPATLPQLSPYFLAPASPMSVLAGKSTGVYEEAEDDFEVRGARADLNEVVFIDGVKVRGDINRPASSPTALVLKEESAREFLVSGRHSVPSQPKPTVLNYGTMELPAYFEYRSIPKLAPRSYLVAQLPNWQSANLLSGQMNIYLNNAYISTTTLNTTQFSDTLQLSFGADAEVQVKREKLEDLSGNQGFRGKKEVQQRFKITVHNSKKDSVKVHLMDQIPLSTDQDISIDYDAPGATVDEMGTLSWDLTLAPGEQVELYVSYSVRYPKNKRVLVH